MTTVYDQTPEQIACLECRDLFRREEIPFPGEGDSCPECEGREVLRFDCAVCDVAVATFDDELRLCEACAKVQRRKERALDNAEDQYESYCRARYLGIEP